MKGYRSGIMERVKRKEAKLKRKAEGREGIGKNAALPLRFPSEGRYGAAAYGRGKLIRYRYRCRHGCFVIELYC